MRVTDFLEARGHPLILGVHPTTFEITKDDWLTHKGTCIIGVNASKAAFELSEELKRAVATDTARIKVMLEADGVRDEAYGTGDSRLKLIDDRSLVVRKSNFKCGRTLMIGSNKAAEDLSRTLIRNLKNRQTRLHVTIMVET